MKLLEMKSRPALYQAALAAQSTQGEFIIAQGSTHNILADRPDVVLGTVATILAACAE